MNQRSINKWNNGSASPHEKKLILIKDLMETVKSVGKSGNVVQMPLRCSYELEERIIRALGGMMTKSGKKISKNDFLIKLIELGLHQLDGDI